MTNRNTILNELNELDSVLGNYSPQNIYTVPNGYFEGLPTQVINRIKALEARDAKEELGFLSPLLRNASKEMPYLVPVGFFQNFADSVMQRINERSADPQTSKEEIESLSPLLSSLKNKNPYSIPAGYFENIQAPVEKKEVKVVSITRRRIYRLAAAAVVIGIIVIGGLLFTKPNSPDPNKDPQAWVEKNVINNKKISTDKIDELVTLVNDENSKPENETTKQAEIKDLLKDVSEKEIEDFLNDAVASNSNDGAETLMN